MAFAAGSTRPTFWRAQSALYGCGRLDDERRQLSRPGHQAPYSRSGAGGQRRVVAQLIEHLKKGDMAREAERLLEGTGWLPEPLRLAETGAASHAATSEADALPDFLADDDQVEAETDEDQPQVAAAE
jgi:hypothetical protein